MGGVLDCHWWYTAGPCFCACLCTCVNLQDTFKSTPHTDARRTWLCIASSLLNQSTVWWIIEMQFDLEIVSHFYLGYGWLFSLIRITCRHRFWDAGHPNMRKSDNCVKLFWIKSPNSSQSKVSNSRPNCLYIEYNFESGSDYFYWHNLLWNK